LRSEFRFEFLVVACPLELSQAPRVLIHLKAPISGKVYFFSQILKRNALSLPAVYLTLMYLTLVGQE
jgi:hypothetical protein